MVFDPIDPHDPLSQIPVDACPECGTVMHDEGCRSCGYVREVPKAGRPPGGDDLPSIGPW